MDSHRYREKKSRRRDYHSGDDKTDYAAWFHYEPMSEFSAGQYQLHNSHQRREGSRLHPSVSDSAVFGPCEFYKPFPIYPPALQHCYREHQPRACCQDFTSLPPNLRVDGDRGRRRFSDPGLNNSCTSSDSEESLHSKVGEGNDITALKEDNARLSLELESAKSEIRFLKTELVQISEKLTCHETFSLAKMVKEIRDAAETRETVLLSKAKLIMEACAKDKLLSITEELNEARSKISEMEREVSCLKLSLKPEYNKMSNGTASADEIVACKSSAAAAKIENGAGKTEEGNNNSSSCESLSSSLGSTSLSNAHILALTGPVTDL